MPEGNGQPWETSDLGTAAYAFMQGTKLLGSRCEGRGRWVFRFDATQDQGEQFQVEYLNSECRKFDSAVRSLKKLCYGDPREKQQAGSRGRR